MTQAPRFSTMRFFAISLIASTFIASGTCSTPRESISKMGITEGWGDDTRFVVVAVAAQKFNQESLQVAAKSACAQAEAKLAPRFSELVLGSTADECKGVDPASDSFCDWNYRLDPTVFTFRGVDFKRRNDFTSKQAICEIAREYRHPYLKFKVAEYRKRFNLDEPTAP